MAAAALLVLGTRNRGKAEELLDLLSPLGIELATLDRFPSAIEVAEEADSFAANAARKAQQQSRHLGQWVLGEDSGLVVDALGGAPGVLSARYAGPRASDDQNNGRLLEALAGVAPPLRTAHYVCHMTLSDPAGAIRAEGEGRCHGRICAARIGSGGFGYDPLFEIAEYHRTFGQLGHAVKRALSHRGRAARALVPSLRSLLETGEWTAAAPKELGKPGR